MQILKTILTTSAILIVFIWCQNHLKPWGLSFCNAHAGCTIEMRCQLHPDSVNGLLFVHGLKHWVVGTFRLRTRVNSKLETCTVMENQAIPIRYRRSCIHPHSSPSDMVSVPIRPRSIWLPSPSVTATHFSIPKISPSVLQSPKLIGLVSSSNTNTWVTQIHMS